MEEAVEDWERGRYIPRAKVRGLRSPIAEARTMTVFAHLEFRECFCEEFSRDVVHSGLSTASKKLLFSEFGNVNFCKSMGAVGILASYW